MVSNLFPLHTQQFYFCIFSYFCQISLVLYMIRTRPRKGYASAKKTSFFSIKDNIFLNPWQVYYFIVFPLNPYQSVKIAPEIVPLIL